MDIWSNSCSVSPPLLAPADTSHRAVFVLEKYEWKIVSSLYM